MAVVIETTVGDITVDLFTEQRPQTCKNFLKLCKIKYYNFCLFHSIQANFIAQTGDPSGSGTGGESIFGVVFGNDRKYYEAEKVPRLKHDKPGLLSMVNCGNSMLGSQFFLTLGADLPSLDEHCVFAEVTEGLDILVKLNDAICDHQHRPYQDIRITHTVILEDPFEDLPGLLIPDASPDINSLELPSSGRIGADEKINDEEGLTEGQLEELKADREAKARATILEIVGDLPDADCAPPENVLFVCKLNPVTTDEDLEIIFSRFGKVKSCEVIRDHQTGDSLQYAFVEFEDQHACEQAFLKMDNVLIDDRRIHVDFSQSVSKIRWKGKGKGVEYTDKDGHRDLSANGSRQGKREPRDRDGKERDRDVKDRDRDRRREVDDRRRRGNDRDTDDYRRRERRKEDGRRRDDESYHRLEEERRRINAALEEDRRRGGEDDRRRPGAEDDRRRAGVEEDRRRAGGEDDRRRGGVGNDDDRRRGGAGAEEERRRFDDDRGEEEKKKRDREDRRREDERRYGSGRREERRREEDRNRRSSAADKKRNGESQSSRDKDRSKEGHRDATKDSSKSHKDSRDKGKTNHVPSQPTDRKESDSKQTKEKVDDRKTASKDRLDDRSRKDKTSSSGSKETAESPNRNSVNAGNSNESHTSKTLSSTPGSQKACEAVDDGRPLASRPEDLNVKTSEPETARHRSAEDFDPHRRQDVDRNLPGRSVDHYDDRRPNQSYDRRSVEHFGSHPFPDYRSVERDRDDILSLQGGGSVVMSDKMKRKKKRKRKSSSSSSSSSESTESSSSSSSADRKKRKRSLTVAKKYYHRGKLVKVVKKKKQKSSDSETFSESSDSDRRRKKSSKYKKIVKVIKKRKRSSDDSDSSSSEDSDDSSAARRRRKRNEKSSKKKRKDCARKSKKKKPREVSEGESSSTEIDNFRSRTNDNRGPY